jgi:hypothetical protein
MDCLYLCCDSKRRRGERSEEEKIVRADSVAPLDENRSKKL